MRVTLDFDKETLKWASQMALNNDITRKLYLERIINNYKSNSEQIYSIDLSTVSPEQLELFKKDFQKFKETWPNKLQVMNKNYDIKRSEGFSRNNTGIAPQILDVTTTSKEE
jgi:hypothetical protein